MITEVQMLKIRSKFYLQAQYFNLFRDIDEESLEMIESKIEHINNAYIKDIKEINYFKLERYYTIVRYLAYNKELTFDEKILILIMMCDPKCLIYNNYKSLELIQNTDIDKAKTDVEKESMRKLNENAIDGYKNATRRVLGFYEAKLLKFEEIYIKRFKKDFVPLCAKDYSDVLFTDDYDFSSILPEDYFRIKATIKNYLEEVQVIDYKTVIYHLIYQNDILKLKNTSEKLLFFIMVNDPDLDFLTVYYEESNWKYIEERCKEQFNFYNKKIFKIEEDYAKLFSPSQKLNLWK